MFLCTIALMFAEPKHFELQLLFRSTSHTSTNDSTSSLAELQRSNEDEDLMNVRVRSLLLMLGCFASVSWLNASSLTCITQDLNISWINLLFLSCLAVAFPMLSFCAVSLQST